MRDYYECQRAEAIVEETLYSDRPTAAFSEGFPTTSNYTRSCGPHACMSHANEMARRLDEALLVATAHAPGALMLCGGS